jgi:hypothetical protein
MKTITLALGQREIGEDRRDIAGLCIDSGDVSDER